VAPSSEMNFLIAWQRPHISYPCCLKAGTHGWPTWPLCKSALSELAGRNFEPNLGRGLSRQLADWPKKSNPTRVGLPCNPAQRSHPGPGNRTRSLALIAIVVVGSLILPACDMTSHLLDSVPLIRTSPWITRGILWWARCERDWSLDSARSSLSR
jgi:hypothetical protein